MLRAHGVRFVFTLIGGHISPLLVACEKLGICVVDTRHEVTAVFAADAVARLTGEGGVQRMLAAGTVVWVWESRGSGVVGVHVHDRTVFQAPWGWRQ